jgi:hypothetical protein
MICLVFLVTVLQYILRCCLLVILEFAILFYSVVLNSNHCSICLDLVFGTVHVFVIDLKV